MNLHVLMDTLQKKINELAERRLYGKEEIDIEAIHLLCEAHNKIDLAIGLMNNKIPLDWEPFVQSGEKVAKYKPEN